MIDREQAIELVETILNQRSRGHLEVVADHEFADDAVAVVDAILALPDTTATVRADEEWPVARMRAELGRLRAELEEKDRAVHMYSEEQQRQRDEILRLQERLEEVEAIRAALEAALREE